MKEKQLEAYGQEIAKKEIEKLSPEERAKYRNAEWKAGKMEEVRGQMRGLGGNALKKLLKGLGWPMSAMERFNRASLGLAAYRLARDGKLKTAARKEYGLKEGAKADYETAKRFATTVVRDSHYVYGKTNAPEFLRSSSAGRGLSPVYTFRSFSHNMLKMWTWALASQGAEGRKIQHILY
jgi:hypothetical protein